MYRRKPGRIRRTRYGLRLRRRMRRRGMHRYARVRYSQGGVTM